MSISREDVVKIAHLARLALNEDKVDAYTKALNQILGHVEDLKALDTEAVSATFSVTGQAETLREDRVVARDDQFRQQVFGAAPQAHETFFAVPQVIE